MKSHYETLGVSSTASKDEIKKIYRSLVMKYHPDTSKVKSQANETKFKQISVAYAVLSDDKKRKQFDLELEEFKKFGRIKRPQGGGSGRAGAHGMAYKFHVLDGIYKPKNMIIGLALGFATVATLKSALGIEEEESRMQKNKREDGKTKLVEAWYNKQSRQWEQPAPWNEHFRKLNPPIEMVDRNKVRQSTS